jgi:hypothetical protein
VLAGPTTAAVVTGLGRTRRLVTPAELILFAVIALATSPGTDSKVFGTLLGVGILVDATIVRVPVVPALVREHPASSAPGRPSRATAVREVLALGAGLLTSRAPRPPQDWGVARACRRSTTPVADVRHEPTPTQHQPGLPSPGRPPRAPGSDSRTPSHE